ncbi:MAG TPA: hypothetical protein VIM12_18020 [Noviherbaspirillum sp.]|uniref:hypothetical protein n=1 Tax=Noviherbaspirillum sp. TaxID=1926288 RepID=UPI002F931BDC
MTTTEKQQPGEGAGKGGKGLADLNITAADPPLPEENAHPSPARTPSKGLENQNVTQPAGLDVRREQ